ncbi:zinc finger CCCH domain-containing protein 44-like isoform X4 [Hordeum vulgare subsp. vulgare]|uniref:zinc finger CCCH domain-containing protein 44-like isoform X4 n=1 Tax=Hordeum vulgare subsp. vulgare TaxID=112509 RepID=UPI001D1A529C|nr:zinc finger CCCH domain-containing protein 44-like isoform X4 [Hordeum vulgare subsp. vulgare]
MGKRKAARPRSGAGGSVPRPVSEGETETEPEPEGEEGDFCFVCKDGGHLRLCDYRNCNKAYHPNCVEKDDDFLNSDEDFICGWHTCCICKGRSYYRCLCCPVKSVCCDCRREIDFVQVGRRQTKGLCANCLRLAIMIENNIQVDSDGERVDFSDRSTVEFLFKEYWEIINKKESLTLDNLQEAYGSLNDGPNHMSDSENSPKVKDSSDDDFLGNIDGGDDEPICPSNLNGTSNKVKPFLKQAKSKKNVYVGWGSKELIGFLESIGKDTSKSLDQFGAAEVVKEYIRQKGLLQKDKKKHVICDERLKQLFRKSNIKYNKIYSLLERHIAANDTSEDETFASSEDNSDSCMKKRTRTMTSEFTTSKGISERNKRCFASLVCDNIKLIYLRKSLVMDLLKQPEAFENKVIGCFVRVKNDPKDYSYHKPKALYQLGQVTGIRKSSEEYKVKDMSTNMLLCVSSCWSEVKISMLSEEDLGEDECEDFRLFVQKENSKRLTVAELEEKARSVHRDIVTHWIDKELKRLDKLIELANEKGWRCEKYEYIDKRQLLRSPSERQRLLEEVPRVIPDLEDNKDTKLLVAASEMSFQMNTATLEGASGERVVCSERYSEESKGANGEKAVRLTRCSKEKPRGANVRAVCLRSCSDDKYKGGNEVIAVCLRSCSEDKYEGGNDARAVCLKSYSEGADEKAAHMKSFSEQKTKALFGTSVLEEIGEDNPPRDWVKPQPSPNSFKSPFIPNTLGASEVRAVSLESCLEENSKATEGDTDTPRTRVQNQGTAGSEDNAAGDKLGASAQKQGAEAGIPTEVINIDGDEDGLAHDEGANVVVVDMDADESGNTHVAQRKTRQADMWHYRDPFGDEQGPFSIGLLDGWNEQGYFDDDFRVWRVGQSSDSAILLKDALRLKR